MAGIAKELLMGDSELAEEGRSKIGAVFEEYEAEIRSDERDRIVDWLTDVYQTEVSADVVSEGGVQALIDEIAEAISSDAHGAQRKVDIECERIGLGLTD